METYSDPKDSTEDGEDKDEDKMEQDLPKDKGGKEALGPGTIDLDRILESISDLMLSVALTQVQAEKEK